MCARARACGRKDSCHTRTCTHAHVHVLTTAPSSDPYTLQESNSDEGDSSSEEEDEPVSKKRPAPGSAGGTVAKRARADSSDDDETSEVTHDTTHTHMH